MNEPVIDRRSSLLQLRWTSPPVVLASAVIIGFFVALFTMLLKQDVGNTDMMVGALIASVTQVISFFFGSSSQSAGKDVAIAELTKTAATVASTAQATQVSANAAAAAAGPIQAGDVAITADTVTVDSTKGKP